MKEKLENAIYRFHISQTSLEAYQAISVFVELIMPLTELIDAIEKERKDIYDKKIEIYNHKRDYTNEYRGRQMEILHSLDTLFCLKNLHDVYRALKPENFLEESYWMFRHFNPDKPMPAGDKEEYRQYMERVYKKALPFLKVENKSQDLEKIKIKSYNETTKILTIGNYKIPIAKNEGNNNAHEIMAYIFIDNKDNLKDKFYYSEIAEKRFGAHYDSKNKYAHQPYSGACDRINDRVKDATNGQVKDFLIFNYSSMGDVRVNPKYL